MKLHADDNSGIPSWDGPASDAGPADFAEARSLKRDLLAELRAGWEEGNPPKPEELLARWPGGPARDVDAASVIFEDYLQRKGHADPETEATASSDSGVNLGGQSTGPTFEE